MFIYYYIEPNGMRRLEHIKLKISRKGEDFDILNELEEDGPINVGGRSKSAYFTENSAKKAEEFIKKYLG